MFSASPLSWNENASPFLLKLEVGEASIVFMLAGTSPRGLAQVLKSYNPWRLPVCPTSLQKQLCSFGVRHAISLAPFRFFKALSHEVQKPDMSLIQKTFIVHCWRMHIAWASFVNSSKFEKLTGSYLWKYVQLLSIRTAEVPTFLTDQGNCHKNTHPSLAIGTEYDV